MRLQDKVIIVTGSTTGIGRAIAERFVREGARVLVHGRNRTEGAPVVAGLGGNAVLHCDDLADPACPARIVQAALQAFGRIDGLINNAAYIVRSTLETTDAAFFDSVMAVNVRAPLLLIQAAMPELRRRQGAVLNIGSINALSGEPALLDYSISKGALQTLSRNLANAHAESPRRRSTGSATNRDPLTAPSSNSSSSPSSAAIPPKPDPCPSSPSFRRPSCINFVATVP